MTSENAPMDEETRNRLKPSRSYELSRTIIEAGLVTIYEIHPKSPSGSTAESKEEICSFPLHHIADLDNGIFNHLLPVDEGLAIHLWDSKKESRYQCLKPGKRYSFEFDLRMLPEEQPPLESEDVTNE